MNIKMTGLRPRQVKMIHNAVGGLGQLTDESYDTINTALVDISVEVGMYMSTFLKLIESSEFRVPRYAKPPRAGADTGRGEADKAHEENRINPNWKPRVIAAPVEIAHNDTGIKHVTEEPRRSLKEYLDSLENDGSPKVFTVADKIKKLWNKIGTPAPDSSCVTGKGNCDSGYKDHINWQDTDSPKRIESIKTTGQHEKMVDACDDVGEKFRGQE